MPASSRYAADPLARLKRHETTAANDAVAEIERARRAIRRDILELTRELDVGGSAGAREEVLSAVQRRIARLRRRLERLENAALEQAARAAVRDGSEKTGVEVRYSRERADEMIGMLAGRRGKCLAAVFTDRMAENVIDALRCATVAALRENAVAGGSKKELARALEEKWLGAAKDGETYQFVDSGGNVWDTKTYVAMNVRTNAMRVYNDSLADTIARATGGDLARVSVGGDPNCRLCFPWEGRILSLTGRTKGFPTYEEARKSGCFHPNCVHTLEYVDELLDADEIELQRAHPMPAGEDGGISPDAADENRYEIDQDRYRRRGMDAERARVAVDRDNLETSIRAGLVREDARQIVDGMTDAQVTALCRDGNPPAFEPTKQATRADPRAADEKWAHGSRGGTVHIGRSVTLERILEVCGVADVAGEKGAWRPSNDAERSLHSFMQELGAEHEDGPQDALESNPHYGEGREYEVNCQRCVPTAEARLRGYDVEALPRPSGTDPMLAGATPLSADWLFPTFKDAKPVRYGRRSDIEKQMREWGVGARAQVVCLNRGGRTAHTFYAVQGADGTHFYDPQTGSHDMSAYLDNEVAYRAKHSAKYNCFARIDALEFNEKVKLCCRARPKTA